MQAPEIDLITRACCSATTIVYGEARTYFRATKKALRTFRSALSENLKKLSAGQQTQPLLSLKHVNAIIVPKNCEMFSSQQMSTLTHLKGYARVKLFSSATVNFDSDANCVTAECVANKKISATKKAL